MNNQIYKELFDFCADYGLKMFREPEGVLKRPYIDPGGPYSKNLWDWDSFWAASALLGIAAKSGNNELKKRTLCHAKGALLTFFENQGEDGSIPILMTLADTDFFGSREDKKLNMAKPVMGQFSKLLDDKHVFDACETDMLLNGLEKFYKCYRERYLNETSGLFVWANDVAVGVDDDPSVWGRPPFSSASIYLNSLMYMDLNAASDFALSNGRSEFAEKTKLEAARLKAAINEFCLDKRDGLYYSADVLCAQNITEIHNFKIHVNLKPFWKCLPLKVAGWSSFMPLWCGIADKNFAARMVHEHLMNREQFWSDYGLRTLSADERMYSPSESRGNPSNWLGPVWIISNYIIWKGLMNYGFEKEASLLSENTCRLLYNDFKSNKKLHEYYDPETGKGISGPGFMNWNLLVCLMMN